MSEVRTYNASGFALIAHAIVNSTTIRPRWPISYKVSITVHKICNWIQEILEEVLSRFTVTQPISISELQQTTREPQNTGNIFCSSLYYSSESRMAHVLFTIVVFVWVQWGPTCVVLCFCFVVVLRLVYPMLPVSLSCPLLIAPSVFSNVYLSNCCSRRNN